MRDNVNKMKLNKTERYVPDWIAEVLGEAGDGGKKVNAAVKKAMTTSIKSLEAARNVASLNGELYKKLTKILEDIEDLRYARDH